MQNTDGEAGKRIFVKVFGFSDVERHALNTVFRLSESRPVTYALWNAEAPQKAELALLDGDSWEAALELANPAHDALKIIWIGERPPRKAALVFARPVQWAAVIEGLDQLYLPLLAEPQEQASQGLDIDLDFDLEPQLDFDISGAAPLVDIDFDLGGEESGQPTEEATTAPMPLEPVTTPSEGPRVLIIGADLEARLYLRARLSIAGLVLVDEAATAAQGLEMAASTAYVAFILDKAVADMSCWKLVRAMRKSAFGVGRIILIGRELSSVDVLRAKFLGLAGALRKPLHPGKLAGLFARFKYSSL